MIRVASMRCHRFAACGFGVLFASLTWILSSPCSHAGQMRVTIAELVERLRQIESRFNSVLVEWEDEIVAPKSKALEEEAKRRGLKGFAKDTSYTAQTLMKLHGVKWRVDGKGKLINPRGEIVDQDMTEAYKNGLLKSLMPEGSQHYPRGTIDKASDGDYPRIINLKPALMIFRPIGARIVNTGNLTIKEDSVQVNGQECVVAEAKAETGVGLNEFYFAKDRDFLIIRWTVSEKSAIVLRCDVDFQRDKGAWLPKNWRLVQESRGRLSQSISATTKKCSYGVKFGEADFEVDFPVGTLVTNYALPSDLGKLTQFVAREKGVERLVTAAEKNATYEELVTSESGQAKRQQGSWGLTLLFALALIVGICGLVYKKIKSGRFVG